MLKDKIITLLRSVKRPGMDNLINYLETSTYFTDPGSVNYHDNTEGGLARHSYNVYLLAMKFNEFLKEPVVKDSIIISSLLHDLVKVGTYVKSKGYEMMSEKQKAFITSILNSNNVTQNYKDKLLKSNSKTLKTFLDNYSTTRTLLDENKFSYYDYNKEVVQFLPHGLTSCKRIEEYIDLTHEEYMSILYHMSVYDESNLKSKEFHQATNNISLVRLVQMADQMSCMNLKEIEDGGY